MTVQGARQEKRFDGDTELSRIRIWRADTLSALLKRQRLSSDRGTFARDFAKFLRTRKGRVSYRADRSHAKPWIAAFGSRKRIHITKAEIVRLLGEWVTDGVAPRTLRHRVRVCREMFDFCDPDGPRLFGKLKLPRPVKTLPLPIDHQIITTVAASLANGLEKQHACGPRKTVATVHRAAPMKTYARFLVYATCGQRPAQIGRAVASDVDLRRKLWFVRPAKGGDPIVLPLNDDMVFAWEVFSGANAWGAFDVSGFVDTLRRHGWPAGLRPYQLRHTFAIDLLLQGVSLSTLQGLLGHLDIRTTRVYAPVQLALSQVAIEQRSLSLRGRVPRGVPRGNVAPMQNAPQTSTGGTVKRTQKKAVS